MWTTEGRFVCDDIVAQKVQDSFLAKPTKGVHVDDVNTVEKVFDKAEHDDYKDVVTNDFVAMYLADGSFRKVPRFLPKSA